MSSVGAGRVGRVICQVGKAAILARRLPPRAHTDLAAFVAFWRRCWTSSVTNDQSSNGTAWQHSGDLAPARGISCKQEDGACGGESASHSSCELAPALAK